MSLVILKLRTWPSARGSGAADGAWVLPFQRAFNMEESFERSGAEAEGCARAAGVAGAGVGLGLSLCQRIILANLGTIRIDSEIGKGTAVTICLPTFESETAAADASPS